MIAIDSHVHLDHIEESHPDRIDWMRKRRIIPISWSFAERIENRLALREYFWNQAGTIHYLNREGFPCFFLVGVHPRNIPEDLHAEEVTDLLGPFLEDPLCLGIGEIGMETGDDREREIFEAQLSLGPTLAALGKRIGVHTPRRDKGAVTEKILSVLGGYPDLPSITVVDHCAAETIGPVLSSGYWAGVSLSPAKTSLPHLREMVETVGDGADRILCNTDSGTEFHEDLDAARRWEHIPAENRRKLTAGNAAAFFGLDLDLLRRGA